MEGNLCWYFNTRNGCRNGIHCPYLHRKRNPSNVPVCRYYRGPGTCRNGDNCFFRHDNDVTNKTSLHGAQIAKEVKVHSASGACSDSSHSVSEEDKENEAVAIDTEKDTAKGSKKWKKRSPGKHKKSPKGHEKYLSVQLNNKVKDDSTPLKSAKKKIDQVSGAEGDSNNNAVTIPDQNEAANQNAEIRTLTCGECGIVLQDSVLDEDDDHLDELEKHYIENFLKMEKNHIKFLEKDPRFKLSTSCGVCGRDFIRTHSLLRHITDKVKSKKNDWKSHEEFLESIVSGLWERDLSLTDESQCMDWLLLHLVESYEGEDSDSDTSNDTDGLDALFGLMTLSKHLHGGFQFVNDYEDDDSPDSDDYGNPWGMDDDDLFELACQGIKPWDPEAGAALSILNGEDDYDF